MARLQHRQKGRTRVRLAEPMALRRWMEYRARHRPWRPNARKEYTEYKRRALEAMLSLVLVCSKCGGLTQWRSAKRAAWARARKKGTAGAEKMRGNDGCTGACTKRPAERAAYKAKMARWIAQIQSGALRIAVWPRHAGDTVAWVEDLHTATKVARDMQSAVHL